jgi:hypothetical protein
MTVSYYIFIFLKSRINFLDVFGRKPFELIRHGIAHEYKQKTINLLYGENFFITLSGADYPNDLESSRG